MYYSQYLENAQIIKRKESEFRIWQYLAVFSSFSFPHLAQFPRSHNGFLAG